MKPLRKGGETGKGKRGFRLDLIDCSKATYRLLRVGWLRVAHFLQFSLLPFTFLLTSFFSLTLSITFPLPVLTQNRLNFCTEFRSWQPYPLSSCQLHKFAVERGGRAYIHTYIMSCCPHSHYPSPTLTLPAACLIEPQLFERAPCVCVINTECSCVCRSHCGSYATHRESDQSTETNSLVTTTTTVHTHTGTRL